MTSQPRSAATTGWTVPLEVGLWRVIQTRPRQEKALSRALTAADIPHEPLIMRREALHGGRKRIVEAPLFPSYLFMKGPREHAFFAVSTRRGARIIEVEDQAGLEAELTQLREALTRGVALDPFPALKAGVRARVSRGPLKGLEGVVEKKTRVDRLILQVGVLGRAVSLEIDPGLLETL